uniref:Growth-regulating factor n=1 Tax=Arundo donax TaxID=35708 RepID=A0A0A9GB10_ARUDO
MRIRKRTPARAASPGPSPAPPTAPLPLPLPLRQPKQEVLHEEEEKRVILVGAGDRQDDRVTAASKNSAMDDVPKPEPGPQHATGAGGRCSRNDGKRWRCKNAVVPGYLFCDRHVAWSTRKRKPRVTKKTKDHGGGVLDPATEELAEQEDAKDEATRTIHLGCDGFYYYGGFQPGCRKRERGGGPGPAAA